MGTNANGADDGEDGAVSDCIICIRTLEQSLSLPDSKRFDFAYGELNLHAKYRDYSEWASPRLFFAFRFWDDFIHC